MKKKNISIHQRQLYFHPPLRSTHNLCLREKLKVNVKSACSYIVLSVCRGDIKREKK